MTTTTDTTRRAKDVSTLLQGADLSREGMEALIVAFEDCTLPRADWTHQAHLIVGLWYVLTHGEQQALPVMSEGIRRYNTATGRTESERSGFRADITEMWIRRIAAYCRRSSPVASAVG